MNKERLHVLLKSGTSCPCLRAFTGCNLVGVLVHRTVYELLPSLLLSRYWFSPLPGDASLVLHSFQFSASCYLRLLWQVYMEKYFVVIGEQLCQFTRLFISRIWFVPVGKFLSDDINDLSSLFLQLFCQFIQILKFSLFIFQRSFQSGHLFFKFIALFLVRAKYGGMWYEDMVWYGNEYCMVWYGNTFTVVYFSCIAFSDFSRSCISASYLSRTLLKHKAQH